MYKAIIFDLDGTLLDTIEDLADSMNIALKSLGFPPRTFEEARAFIGNGVPTFAERSLPEGQKTKDNISRLVHAMETAYLDNYKNKTYIYKGVMELLVELRKKSLALAVNTNKIDSMAKKIVDEYFPRATFAKVLGSLPQQERKPHPAGALSIAEELKILPSECLFIGDSEVDVETGKRAGMKTLAVSWGSRTREQLNACGADFVFDTPEEILNFILKANSKS